MFDHIDVEKIIVVIVAIERVLEYLVRIINSLRSTSTDTTGDTLPLNKDK